MGCKSCQRKSLKIRSALIENRENQRDPIHLGMPARFAKNTTEFHQMSKGANPNKKLCIKRSQEESSSNGHLANQHY
jgi:hypothetical protein